MHTDEMRLACPRTVAAGAAFYHALRRLRTSRARLPRLRSDRLAGSGTEDGDHSTAYVFLLTSVATPNMLPDGSMLAAAESTQVSVEGKKLFRSTADVAVPLQR